MDICACLSAERLSCTSSVTLSMDSLTFHNDAVEGDALKVIAQVTKVFNTSVEIFVSVSVEDNGVSVCSAFFVFVSLNTGGKKISLPAALPETETEQLLYMTANDRRSLRMNSKQLLEQTINLTAHVLLESTHNTNDVLKIRANESMVRSTIKMIINSNPKIKMMKLVSLA